jgi:5,10-methylenetetrahydromethanopterin reductase
MTSTPTTGEGERMSMEIGLSIGLSPREDLRRFVALCQQAESSGVNAIWVIDSQLAMKDPYTAMAIGLWETEHLKFGTGVTNIQTRDLSVTANAAATLSDMSRGRYLLGLGAGDSAVFPLGREPSTIKELQPAVTTLRSLLRGEPVDGSGGQSIHLAFTPTIAPPLYLAASQPRMLALAGSYADGVIVMGAANDELIANQLDFVAQGMSSVGRKAGDVAIDLWVTIAVDDGDGRAVDAVRSWASAKARWMARWKDLPESLVPFRSELERSAAEYDFSSHLSLRAKHANTVSDDLARVLAVAGDVDHCIDRLNTLIRLRPTRLTLSLLSGGREKRLNTLMNEIIPAMTNYGATLNPE